MSKLGLVLIVLTMACKAKEAPPATESTLPGPPTRGEPTRPESPQPEMPPELPAEPVQQSNMSGAMPRRMANCPSTVPGATTTLAETPDGIEITVTSTDAAAERRILELAEFHAGKAVDKPGIQHTGQRQGPARIGFCPTVYAGATMTSTPVAGGARMRLTASSPESVKELRDAMRARAMRLPGFVSS